MNPTKIEWCDYTWNPVTGCKHDCPYCYARKIAKTRLKGRYGYPLDEPFRPTFHEDHLLEPLQVKKPAKIFVVSMGDLFGEWVPDEWILKVLDVVRCAPQHTFQFFTKNPKRYEEFKYPLRDLPNAWLGTSIESGRQVQRVIDLYNSTTDDNIRSVSIEPIHGPVSRELLKMMDWVIVGAETGGRKGKIYHEAGWIVDIEFRCRRLKIPLFIKSSIPYDKIQEFPKGKAEI